MVKDLHDRAGTEGYAPTRSRLFGIQYQSIKNDEDLLKQVVNDHGNISGLLIIPSLKKSTRNRSA
jgi:hypothetical protein